MKALRSGKGPCCDGGDAKRIDDADWEIEEGHYRVRIDGEWVDVPWEAVVDGPNREGRTMVLALLQRWSSESALLRAGKHELMLRLALANVPKINQAKDHRHRRGTDHLR